MRQEIEMFRRRTLIHRLTMVLAACAAIVALRTRVRWEAVLPAGPLPDRAALKWYKGLLSAATGCGLKTMVVLSSPPKAILDEPRAKKLSAWAHFVQVVAEDLGVCCEAYQLLNEPNNPVYRFFSLPEAVEAITHGVSVLHVAHR